MKAMLVDDEAQRAPVRTIRELLEAEGVQVDAGYEFVGKLGADDFCARVRRLERPPDIAVIDYSLHWKDLEGGEWNGDRVARFLREHWISDLPFYILFVSSYLKSMATPYEQLVDLLKVPFAGFVELGPNWEDGVRQHVRWACDLVRAEKDRSITAVTSVGAEVAPFFGEAIVGRAPSLIQVGQIARKVSQTNATVLITGESGTGKELIARAIHGGSSRKGKPFVKINCAALPEELIESELFGHEKGAFTGAADKRVGKFEVAHQGTIFLDEIGDMSAKTQAKVLRVLQEREFERLGSNRNIQVDVRIIAATNKDLKDEIARGRFRDDLFQRLNVVPVVMPPLRERASDVADLAEYFLRKFAAKHSVAAQRFSPAALKAIQSYAWPGNVRELENAVEHATVLCDGTTVEASHLPAKVLGGQPTNSSDTWPDALEEFKRAYFSRTLNESAGSVTKAAKRAGVSREHFSKTLTQLGIQTVKEQ